MSAEYPELNDIDVLEIGDHSSKNTLGCLLSVSEDNKNTAFHQDETFFKQMQGFCQVFLP